MFQLSSFYVVKKNKFSRETTDVTWQKNIRQILNIEVSSVKRKRRQF